MRTGEARSLVLSQIQSRSCGGVPQFMRHGVALAFIATLQHYLTPRPRADVLPPSAGGLTIALEVRSPTEHQKKVVHDYASFMHSFLGRGICE